MHLTNVEGKKMYNIIHNSLAVRNEFVWVINDYYRCGTSFTRPLDSAIAL